MIASRFCIKCVSVALKVLASELRASSFHSGLKCCDFSCQQLEPGVERIRAAM